MDVEKILIELISTVATLSNKVDNLAELLHKQDKDCLIKEKRLRNIENSYTKLKTKIIGDGNNLGLCANVRENKSDFDNFKIDFEAFKTDVYKKLWKIAFIVLSLGVAVGQGDKIIKLLGGIF